MDKLARVVILYLCGLRGVVAVPEPDASYRGHEMLSPLMVHADGVQQVSAIVKIFDRRAPPTDFCKNVPFARANSVSDAIGDIANAIAGVPMLDILPVQFILSRLAGDSLSIDQDQNFDSGSFANPPMMGSGSSYAEPYLAVDEAANFFRDKETASVPRDKAMNNSFRRALSELTLATDSSSIEGETVTGNSTEDASPSFTSVSSDEILSKTENPIKGRNKHRKESSKRSPMKTRSRRSMGNAKKQPQANRRRLSSGRSEPSEDSEESSFNISDLLNTDINNISDSLLSALSTDMMLSLTHCLVPESDPSGKTISFKSGGKGLVTCACEALNKSLSTEAETYTACMLFELLSAGLICKDYKRKCLGPIPSLAYIGFEECGNSPYKSGSHSLKPNVDFDFFLHPRSDLASEGEMLPETVPQPIVDSEGLTYYYSFRSALILGDLAQKQPCGNLTIPEFIPGWKSVMQVNLIEEGNLEAQTTGFGKVPFTFFLRRGCDVILPMRSSLASLEWMLTFTYDQIFSMLPPFGKNRKSPVGKHHRGYGSIAAAILPSIVSAYAQVLDECSSEVYTGKRRIIIAGYSIGGAVGAIVAHFLAVWFGDAVEVSAVLVGPARAFDKEASDEYHRLVNSRVFLGELDISDFPCSTKQLKKGLPSCPNAIFNTGVSSQFWHYEPYKALIKVNHQATAEFAADDRWVDRDIFTWSFLEDKPIQAFSAIIFSPYATHLYLYQCYLGKYCHDPSKLRWACSDNTIEGNVRSIEPAEFTKFEFNIRSETDKPKNAASTTGVETSATDEAASSNPAPTPEPSATDEAASSNPAPTPEPVP